jgi:hypothetical protein
MIGAPLSSLNQVGDFEQVPGPLMGRHLAPGTFLESFARGLDRLVDILRPRLGHFGEHLLIGGVEAFKGLAGFRRHPFAVDQELLRAALEKLQSPGTLGAPGRNFQSWCRCHDESPLFWA